MQSVQIIFRSQGSVARKLVDTLNQVLCASISFKGKQLKPTIYMFSITGIDKHCKFQGRKF